MQDLPVEFRQAVGKLRFVPVAERVIEAKHKDIKRELAHLTRHSASRVSTAARKLQVLEALRAPASRDALAGHLNDFRTAA